MLALVATLAVGATLTACEDDPVDPDPPTAPTNVTVTVDGTSLDVSWGAVSNADSYRVTLSEGNAVIDTENTSGTSTSFSGLTQGATYAVLVTAINADGEASANPVTASIPAPDAPDAPTGIITTAGQTDLEVSWDASDGADSYRVTVSEAGTAVASETTSNTSITFDGLTPGATYAVQVTAINDQGEASASTSVTMESNFVLVNNDILENTTWTSDKIWILTQPIFVGQDCGIDGTAPDCMAATLTIEPGTTVLGRSQVPQGVRGAYLVVTRGSRLVADATSGEDRAPTADEVIVFTSDKPRGQRASEDWGGLVINGMAPTNAGDEAQGEGDSGFYGGTDDNDDSGILRGVRIEFAGDDVTPADQLNGLALQGVGAGTTISYVQIHYNKDDGIEPFGGTVSVDHLVVTGIGDDSVDGTDGYRGFMQFIVGQQRGADADQGFEISNNGDDGDAAPHSTSVIANATMIGAFEGAVDGEIAGPESDRGVEFREGSRYRLYNTIIAGFDTGFRINDGTTVVAAQNRMAGQTAPDNTMSAEGIILWNNAEMFEDSIAQAFFETPAFNNMVADPGLDASVYDYGSMSSPPDFTVADMPAGYTAFDLSAIAFDTDLVAPLDGRTLVSTSYAGAIEPGTALADAWYNGWTVWTIAGDDSRPNEEGN
jgi:hypothetical protein